MLVMPGGDLAIRLLHEFNRRNPQAETYVTCLHIAVEALRVNSDERPRHGSAGGDS